MNWVELVGYVASAFVVLSFAMSSIVKIRTISLVGSVFYVAYGVLIGSVPIILANATIVVFHCIALFGSSAASPSSAPPPSRLTRPSSSTSCTHTSTTSAGPSPSTSNAPPTPPSSSCARACPRAPSSAPATATPSTSPSTTSSPPTATPNWAEWIYGSRTSALRAHGIREVTAAPTTDVHRHYLEHVGFERRGESLAKSLA